MPLNGREREPPAGIRKADIDAVRRAKKGLPRNSRFATALSQREAGHSPAVDAHEKLDL